MPVHNAFMQGLILEYDLTITHFSAGVSMLIKEPLLSLFCYLSLLCYLTSVHPLTDLDQQESTVSFSRVWCQLTLHCVLSLAYFLILRAKLFSLSLCCRTIRPNSAVRSIYKASGCSSNPNRHVNYLEHVVVRITITHPRRGDLAIYLTSPSGTRSQLLANRYNEDLCPQ